MGETSGGRARATYLSYRSLGEVLARLPEPLAQGAAGAVAGSLATLPPLPHGAAAMYLRHLERVLGRPVRGLERRRWIRRAFRAYARYWLEGARIPTTPTAVVEARMTVERGWDEFTAAMAAGNGVIMALPHVGSWEWGGAYLAAKGYPMTAVAELLEPPELYEWFVSERKRMGLTILPLGPEAGGALLRTLRDGGLVGLLCDRDVGGGGVEVEFFGERTTLPAGPATLALRTGAALMPTAVYSGPGPGHTGVILPAVDTTRQGGLRHDVQRVTQEVARGLEVLIRRAPEQWHLFQPNWPSDRSAAQVGASSAAADAAR
ncbi:MAG: phosphatidylinositol mannoside acyltransferase [Acidimicrobiales bacterium]